MAEFENTKLGIKVVTADLTQGMLEKYLEKLKGKSDMPIGAYYGEMVRSAVECGWLIEPKWSSDDIAKQKPMVVRWIGQKLDKIYGEETQVPPE